MFLARPHKCNLPKTNNAVTTSNFGLLVKANCLSTNTKWSEEMQVLEQVISVPTTATTVADLLPVLARLAEELARLRAELKELKGES